MAKKRDREQTEAEERRAEPAETYEGSAGLQSFEDQGMSFAGTERNESALYPDDGDVEAWEEDLETAPDLFADASDEDQMMSASEGQEQLRGDETEGSQQQQGAPNRRRR